MATKSPSSHFATASAFITALSLRVSTTLGHHGFRISIPSSVRKLVMSAIMSQSRLLNTIRLSIPEGCCSVEPRIKEPVMGRKSNKADELERLLMSDGFQTWGFVIYRCTYKSDADWARFMTLLREKTLRNLKGYNGLDLLNQFSPTVFDDPSFEGATAATLRAHFNQWAVTASEYEKSQQIKGPCVRSSRYRFFVMVDQEALESVLSCPNDQGSAFVRLVYADCKLEAPGQGEEAGLIKVPYDEVEFNGFVDMCNEDNWDLFHARTPHVRPLSEVLFRQEV